MPKRACPFQETFSSQYKIHIGQQELNNYGVYGNKYRQEIHGKYMLANVSFVVAYIRELCLLAMRRWTVTKLAMKQSRLSLFVHLFMFLKGLSVYNSGDLISWTS